MSNRLNDAVDLYRKTENLDEALFLAMGGKKPLNEASQTWVVPNQAALYMFLLKIGGYAPEAEVSVNDHQNGYAVVVSGKYDETAIASLATDGIVRVDNV